MFFGEGITIAQLRQIYPNERETPMLHVKRMTLREIHRFYDEHKDNYHQFTYPVEYPTSRQWTERGVVHEVRIRLCLMIGIQFFPGIAYPFVIVSYISPK
jgi:hypothetical protein